MTGMTDGSCFGEYFHRILGPPASEMSRANTLFGNAEFRYIVLPTTMGEPS
jgi:hypothetical protein